MSLFGEKNMDGPPTLFPTQAAPKRRRRVVTGCCEEWSSFDVGDDRERIRAWAHLHQLCHSRTAFTVSYLAEAVGLSMKEAGQFCQRAVAMKWLVIPQMDAPALPHVGAMYVGALSRRK